MWLVKVGLVLLKQDGSGVGVGTGVSVGTGVTVGSCVGTGVSDGTGATVAGIGVKVGGTGVDVAVVTAGAAVVVGSSGSGLSIGSGSKVEVTSSDKSWSGTSVTVGVNPLVFSRFSPPPCRIAKYTPDTKINTTAIPTAISTPVKPKLRRILIQAYHARTQLTKKNKDEPL